MNRTIWILFLCSISLINLRAEGWETIYGDKEGQSGGVDISYTIGKQQVFFKFRNRFNNKIEIGVGAICEWENGSQTEDGLYATLKPNETQPSSKGGNFTLTRPRRILGFKVTSLQIDGEFVDLKKSPINSPREIRFPARPEASARSVPNLERKIDYEASNRRLQELREKQQKLIRTQDRERQRHTAEANAHVGKAQSYQNAGQTAQEGIQAVGNVILDNMRRKQAEEERQREIREQEEEMRKLKEEQAEEMRQLQAEIDETQREMNEARQGATATANVSNSYVSVESVSAEASAKVEAQQAKWLGRWIPTKGNTDYYYEWSGNITVESDGFSKFKIRGTFEYNEFDYGAFGRKVRKLKFEGNITDSEKLDDAPFNFAYKVRGHFEYKDVFDKKHQFTEAVLNYVPRKSFTIPRPWDCLEISDSSKSFYFRHD